MQQTNYIENNDGFDYIFNPIEYIEFDAKEKNDRYLIREYFILNLNSNSFLLPMFITFKNIKYVIIIHSVITSITLYPRFIFYYNNISYFFIFGY